MVEIKVAHIMYHSYPDVSGYSIRGKSIVGYLAHRGVRQIVVTAPGVFSQSERETLDGVEYYRAPEFHHPLGGVPLVKWLPFGAAFRRHIRGVLRKFRPHIVHAHEAFAVGPSALASARNVGSAFVYEIRGMVEESDRINRPGWRSHLKAGLDRRRKITIMRQADAVIALSQGILDRISEYGIDSGKVYHVGNAVDTQRLVPAHPSHQGPVTLGYIGSMRKLEGLAPFLRAVADTVKTWDAKVLLVGGGPELPELRALVGELGLEDHVELTGSVEHDRVFEYYRKLDLLVVPRVKSVVTDNVTPLKPLEAMALGIPILASDVGALREYITDGENGYLFSAGNDQAARKKLVWVLDNPRDRARIAENALDWVRRHRDRRVVFERYLEIYERLCHNKD